MTRFKVTLHDFNHYYSDAVALVPDLDPESVTNCAIADINHVIKETYSHILEGTALDEPQHNLMEYMIRRASNHVSKNGMTTLTECANAIIWMLYDEIRCYPQFVGEQYQVVTATQSNLGIYRMRLLVTEVNTIPSNMNDKMKDLIEVRMNAYHEDTRQTFQHY